MALDGGTMTAGQWWSRNPAWAIWTEPKVPTATPQMELLQPKSFPHCVPMAKSLNLSEPPLLHL